MTTKIKLKGAWYQTTVEGWVFTNNPSSLKGRILKGPCDKPN